MSFGNNYCYPNSEKPEFIVKTIEGRYKFIFLDEAGKEQSTFSINSKTVENIYSATDYQGDNASAIEKFRDFGKEKWPERFKGY